MTTPERPRACPPELVDAMGAARHALGLQRGVHLYDPCLSEPTLEIRLSLAAPDERVIRAVSIEDAMSQLEALRVSAEAE